jgi:hypothetical protein
VRGHQQLGLHEHDHDSLVDRDEFDVQRAR